MMVPLFCFMLPTVTHMLQDSAPTNFTSCFFHFDLKNKMMTPGKFYDHLSPPSPSNYESNIN